MRATSTSWRRRAFRNQVEVEVEVKVERKTKIKIKIEIEIEGKRAGVIPTLFPIAAGSPLGELS